MPDVNMKQLIIDIKTDEGTILHCYKDSLGYDTIGTGINIDSRGGGITIDENDYLLGNRLHRIIGGLDAKLPWIVLKSDNIQRQLINMAFNMGLNGLLNFKNMLEYIRVGKYDEAADAALDSIWARQVPNRAKRISNLIRKG